MDSLVITVNDIRALRPVAKELDQERVEPFIREAQMHDLRPILGDALYYDFVNKFQSTGDPMYANYQNLLNGSVWTVNGKTKQHYGLKPIVVYYALARFVANNQINITRFGVTSKVNPQSEPVTDLALRNMITELKSVAVSYQSQTIDFLRDNASIYTLFSQDILVNNMGLKFFDI